MKNTGSIIYALKMKKTAGETKEKIKFVKQG